MPVASHHNQPQHYQLIEFIIDKINQTSDKRITFADFMQHALYAPQLGYYTSEHAHIGRQGDFITAPTLSILFADCLAKQTAQVFQQIPQPNIIEFGAGTGDLAAQLLLALAKRQALPTTYFILEPSAQLRAQQQQTLQMHCPQYSERVTWLETLPEQPLSAVVIANEVVDAMPVHIVHYQQQLYERYVTCHGTTFDWVQAEPSTAQLLDYWQQLNIASEVSSYTTEINLFALAWVNSVSEILSCGALFIVDYGFPQHEYYHPSRQSGTLMCHYQQQAHPDPFWLPGLQDITTHVNFTALAAQAVACGLTVAGFTSQAAFLLNCNILASLQQAQQACATSQERVQLNQQVHMLTAPHEMGELFKVMALTRGVDIALLGFEQYDQRHRL